MTSNILNHPELVDFEASYGVDHKLGYFAEVRRAGMTVAEYDNLHHPENTRDGVLEFLVEHGFLTNQEVVQTSGLMEVMTWREIDELEFSRCAAVLKHLDHAVTAHSC